MVPAVRRQRQRPSGRTTRNRASGVLPHERAQQGHQLRRPLSEGLIAEGCQRPGRRLHPQEREEGGLGPGVRRLKTHEAGPLFARRPADPDFERARRPAPTGPAARRRRQTDAPQLHDGPDMGAAEYSTARTSLQTHASGNRRRPRRHARWFEDRQRGPSAHASDVDALAGSASPPTRISTLYPDASARSGGARASVGPRPAGSAASASKTAEERRIDRELCS
jgi:hypothetical protein